MVKRFRKKKVKFRHIFEQRDVSEKDKWVKDVTTDWQLPKSLQTNWQMKFSVASRPSELLSNMYNNFICQSITCHWLKTSLDNHLLATENFTCQLATSTENLTYWSPTGTCHWKVHFRFANQLLVTENFTCQSALLTTRSWLAIVLYLLEAIGNCD